jgi:hypothetical protein
MPKREQRVTISDSADLRRFKRQLWVFAVILLVIVLLAACGDASSPRNELGENQTVLRTCDPASPPASLVEIDGTGSSDSDAVTAQRMVAIESVVRRTAVCSGHLRVLVFSASSTATTVLFDGSMAQAGATDNARLKKVPDAVASVMEKVRAGYGPALKALSQNGSDITAQYRLAAEWMQQLGGNYKLNLIVLTDGFQNIRVDLTSRAVSKQEAEALASEITVPKLPGASVVVAGLGHVAGNAPPSSIVEGLVSFYDALCAKTSAAKCVSVSDFSTEGR